MNETVYIFNEDPLIFREQIQSRLNHRREKIWDLAKKKEAAKLSNQSLESGINFSPLIKIMESGKIITSVNYRGQKSKELQKRHGYIRQGFHYIPQTATQRVLFRLASKKRLRTFASKGMGFKRRMRIHMKLAWKRRRSMGL